MTTTCKAWLFVLLSWGTVGLYAWRLLLLGYLALALSGCGTPSQAQSCGRLQEGTYRINMVERYGNCGYLGSRLLRIAGDGKIADGSDCRGSAQQIAPGSCDYRTFRACSLATKVGQSDEELEGWVKRGNQLRGQTQFLRSQSIWGAITGQCAGVYETTWTWLGPSAQSLAKEW